MIKQKIIGGFFMAKQKKPVHKVQMTKGKRNIIHQLLEEYDIKTAKDIQDALKDLLGGTTKEMMEAEMDDYLGYEKSECSDNDDYRNGYKSKQVNSSYGAMEFEVPQDRKSVFNPQVIKKHQKDISDTDQKIISMYAEGMTTRQISETIEDIYGFDTSEGFISDVTDKILPQIEDWQRRPLDEVYPILYIDAIHYSVRDNGVIRKLAAYVILGINTEGEKEVLTISVGDNESSKYWLSVLNELKNRGAKDILIICADGLSGIKEAIATAFPKTEYQLCIVHQVRNMLKYVPDKDRKAFAADLKKSIRRQTKRKLWQHWTGSQKMDAKISEFHETLEGQLGCDFSDIQVFSDCPEGHIYNQCNRITEFHIPETESSEERVSKRYGFVESPVSGNIRSH